MRKADRETHAGLVPWRARFSLSVPTAAASIPVHPVRRAWMRVSTEAASVGSQARAAPEARISRMASRRTERVLPTRDAESNSPSVREHFEAHARHSAVEHVQLARRFPGEID